MHTLIDKHQALNQKIYLFFSKYIPEGLRAQRERLLSVFFYFMLIFYTLGVNYIGFSLGFRLIVHGATFLFMLALYCEKEKEAPIVPRKTLWMAAFYLMGLGAFLTAVFVRSRAYFLLTLIWLFLYPFARLVLQPNVFFAWVERYCIVLIRFFLVVVVLALFLSPLTAAQYTAVYSDPNDLAMLCVMVILSSLYLLYKGKPQQRKKYFAYTVLATAMILFSRSRTGMVMMLWAYVLFFAYLHVQKKNVFRKILRFVGGTVGAYVLLYLLLTFLTPMSARTIFPLISPEYAEALKEHEGEEISFEESFTLLVQKSMKGAGDNHDVSSGRMRIWTAGVQRLRPLGHLDERVYVWNYEHRMMLLHNAFLQIWYSIGILGAAGYILLMASVIKDSWPCLRNLSKISVERLTVLGFLGSYAIYLLFFSSYNPFVSPLAWIAYFVSMAPTLPERGLVSKEKPCLTQSKN